VCCWFRSKAPWTHTCVLPPPTHTQTDTKLERDRAHESESAWRAQREELQQQLEALRLEHAEALVRQREEAAVQMRAIKVRWRLRACAGHC